MSLKHILLALTKEPVSGYDLNQVIDETISHFWTADQAQLYRALKQLEESGLVTRKECEPERGPAKKTYCRTVEGRVELVRWLESGPHLTSARSAYVAQLVFLHEACDLSVTLKFLETLRAQFTQSLEQFLAVDAAEPQVAMIRQKPEDFHGALGLRLAMDVSKARLEWCEWAIRTIKRRVNLEREGK